MSERYILFDLDGTLTDPGIGITNCVGYALQKCGVYPASREELYPYIGPSLTWGFQRYHGLSEEQAKQALTYYRERFSVKGMYENEVYDGIPALLEELRGRGARLLVATSKPEEFTNEILRHFGLAEYFDFVAGNTLDDRRPTKASVIAYLQEKYPAITARNSIMVGDREYDILGARERGLPAVGVLYGYGSREELEKAAAAHIVEDIPALHEFLINRLY
ncbi:MAG: HAD hydrolase-like protein [Clostridia bacterium]|nr:HAD hydrolase-like protein [Clostridia bacterium]